MMRQARRKRSVEDAVFGLLEDAFNTLGDLKRDEREQYAQDLIEAVADVRDTHDLTPIVRVVEAWQRTMLFARQPGFEQRIASAKGEMDEEEPMSWDEIRDTLSV